MTPSNNPQAPINLPQAIQLAQADLARRLNVSTAAIQVLEAKAVTWRDGSLGCPQPGMMYTQALVDGYFIRLSVGGIDYDYHGSLNRAPFLCRSSDE